MQQRNPVEDRESVWEEPAVATASEDAVRPVPRQLTPIIPFNPWPLQTSQHTVDSCDYSAWSYPAAAASSPPGAHPAENDDHEDDDDTNEDGCSARDSGDGKNKGIMETRQSHDVHPGSPVASSGDGQEAESDSDGDEHAEPLFKPGLLACPQGFNASGVIPPTRSRELEWDYPLPMQPTAVSATRETLKQPPQAPPTYTRIRAMEPQAMEPPLPGFTYEQMGEHRTKQHPAFAQNPNPYRQPTSAFAQDPYRQVQSFPQSIEAIRPGVSKVHKSPVEGKLGALADLVRQRLVEKQSCDPKPDQDPKAPVTGWGPVPYQPQTEQQASALRNPTQHGMFADQAQCPQSQQQPQVRRRQQAQQQQVQQQHQQQTRAPGLVAGASEQRTSTCKGGELLVIDDSDCEHSNCSRTNSEARSVPGTGARKKRPRGMSHTEESEPGHAQSEAEDDGRGGGKRIRSVPVLSHTPLNDDVTETESGEQDSASTSGSSHTVANAEDGSDSDEEMVSGGDEHTPREFVILHRVHCFYNNGIFKDVPDQLKYGGPRLAGPNHLCGIEPVHDIEAYYQSMDQWECDDCDVRNDWGFDQCVSCAKERPVYTVEHPFSFLVLNEYHCGQCGKDLSVVTLSFLGCL